MLTTLPAFDPAQRLELHRLLAVTVAQMMGRKLEEDDWTSAYCLAKGIAHKGWSNLDIDVIHMNLGVEHKMLCYRSVDIETACGQRLMHPSLTRSIRIDPSQSDPNIVMTDVLGQYGDLIASRREVVRQQYSGADPIDLRIGWLLWQESLRQFLYFEVEQSAPSPVEYYAEWRSSGTPGGRRKQSRNLWIYEKATGIKRYSVTTSAGIKIQPYFDVPPPNDPNLYVFTVIGEHLDTGRVRVWLTRRTARSLENLLGDLEPETVERAILAAAAEVQGRQASGDDASPQNAVEPLEISIETYGVLVAAFPARNDEHAFQLLVDALA